MKNELRNTLLVEDELFRRYTLEKKENELHKNNIERELRHSNEIIKEL